MPHWYRIVPCLAVMWLVSGCAQPAAVETEPPLPAIVTPLGQGGAAAPAPVSTFTPTPTPPPDGQIPPTLPPAPTETPTVTLVPTVIPPALPAPDTQPPTGWFAYTTGYQLDPANVNPSTIACHLHVANFDGSNDLNLTPGSSDCAAAPVISPDGGWIAFLSGYARNMGAGMAASLNVVSIDGAQIRTFRPSPLSTGGVRWSKDESQIAYYFQGDSQWHVIDAQTGAAIATVSTLPVESWYFPNLSPDGKYRAAYCEPDIQEMKYRVCITELAVDTRPLGLWLDGGITWSPDGQWIGYVVQDGSATGDTSRDGAYVMHPDGTGAVRISTTPSGALWFGAAR